MIRCCRNSLYPAVRAVNSGSRPQSARRAGAPQATVGAMSSQEPDESLLHSPLHAEHVALGATMGAFGGWDMPISYAGAGVVAEHTAVRTAVGVFDVSHLGKASVTGPDALQHIVYCA